MCDEFDKIQTGDVVVMSSITPFAVFVKWCVASEYNHVAVAVRIDESVLPKIKVVKNKGLLCLIEFNGDDYKNILTGEIHHGNRLIVFSDIILKYKKIAIRKLHKKYYTKNFESDITKFIYKYCNHLSKMDFTILFFKIIGLELNNDEKNENPNFCSELTAKFYGDLIKGSIDTNYQNLLPHNFISNKYNHIFEQDLIIVKNEYHEVMDFFHNGLFWVLALIILIVIIGVCIFCAKKVYKVKREKF